METPASPLAPTPVMPTEGMPPAEAFTPPVVAEQAEQQNAFSRFAGFVGRVARAGYVKLGMAQAGVEAAPSSAPPETLPDAAVEAFDGAVDARPNILRPGRRLAWKLGVAAVSAVAFSAKAYLGARHGIETGGTGGHGMQLVGDVVNTNTGTGMPDGAVDVLAKDGQPTNGEGTAAAVVGGIGVGLGLAVWAGRAIRNRYHEAQHLSHERHLENTEADLLRGRAELANASMEGRWTNRRTGRPDVHGSGGSRVRHPATILGVGQVTYNQDPLREYRPAEAGYLQPNDHPNLIRRVTRRILRLTP
ncbi:MAG TPA: hypothetical protein VF466_02575 [Candidatus Saccharimonadales bacterium]